MEITKEQINSYFAANANIIIPGILGPWEFTLKNLHYEKKASGFLGGGIHKNVWYVLSLNGKPIKTTSDYLSVHTKIINYVKLQIKNGNN